MCYDLMVILNKPRMDDTTILIIILEVPLMGGDITVVMDVGVNGEKGRWYPYLIIKNLRSKSYEY